MLDVLPSDLDKSEGSFVWDAVTPASMELAQAALWAQEVLRRGFAATAFGPYLDLRCEEHGVTRRSAVKATGQVQFQGKAGTVIPAGTRLATPADAATGTASVEFVTTTAVNLDAGGSGTAAIEAVEAGSKSNVLPGAIMILASSVPGVASVGNAAATAGGADIETDASLLSRYYAKVRSPGTSGNKADYASWSMEVGGVGGAQVLPLWNGPGTVKIVLIGTDKRPVSPAIVSSVQNYIAPAAGDGKAPIGAAVTVVAAAGVNIHVTATVTLTGTKSLAQVQEAFERELDAYLGSIAFSADPTVRYVRIGSILLDADGVRDYANLLVNGGTANVAVEQGQVAVRGTVTLA